MQKKYTHPYQILHESLIDWQQFPDKNAPVTTKPFFVLLTHTHCMWTEKLRLEAFTNPHIASVIHKHFTPCIIDKHIDPELYILMNQALKVCLNDQNIRPGCLFVHNTGIPYFGGGYHPPSPKYGMPSFLQFLHHAINIESESMDLSSTIARHNTPQHTSESWCYSLDSRIDSAYEDAFDFMNHGFGIAPKYLHIDRLKAWYTYPHRKKTVRDTIATIATSPTLDPLNGCVYRKCEDANWEIPVRESSLSEQTTFISLMMHTHPNTPCIDFLLEQIHQQFLLDGGVFANSISYHPPHFIQHTHIQWHEENPFFEELPTIETCTFLQKQARPNISFRDDRAILSANSQHLKTLIQHQKQQPSHKNQKRIYSLEESLWLYFGWNTDKCLFHTPDKEMIASGLDITLFIQSLVSLQEWSPTPHRHKRLLDVVAFWEEQYIHESTCYTHPNQRFFSRGIDLIADTAASTQEEAAYTLSLLHDHKIPTKNTPHAFIQKQLWLVYKNPKIMSSILHAWNQSPPPFSQEDFPSKAILVFDLHEPQSHQFLSYTKNMDVFRWAHCEHSKKYLEQCGYRDVIHSPQKWIVCNQKGQTHIGQMHAQDIKRFLCHSSPPPQDETRSALGEGQDTYIHSTYSIAKKEELLVYSEDPILCFCIDHENSIWWMTENNLYSSFSNTPHKLPSPLSSPIDIKFFQGSLLIADRKGLWIFHIHQERFGRYAGTSGTAQQDGLLQHAVFRNITALCTYSEHILIADAYTLRVINPQQGVVQTLDIGAEFVYASSILMFGTHIFIADLVSQCVWRYSLKEERTAIWSCQHPQSLFRQQKQLFILCEAGILAISEQDFIKKH